MALKQKKVVSVFSDSTRLTMVNSGGGDKVIKAVTISLDKGVINRNHVVSKDRFVKTLEEAKRRLKIVNNKECVMCLSGNEIVRIITLPKMDDSSLAKNVIAEASKYLPDDVSTYNVDYKIIDRSQNEDSNNCEIFVVAVKKDFVDTLMECFSKAKLRLKYVDILESSFEKMIKNIEKSKNPSSFGLLEISYNYFAFSVYLDGKYYVKKVSNLGIANMVNYVKDYVDMDESKILDNLEKIVLSKDTANTNNTIIYNTANHWVEDINNVLDYFKNKNKQKQLDAIYMVGSGTRIGAIKEHLKSINVPIISGGELVSKMYKKEKDQKELNLLVEAVSATYREGD